MTSSQFVVFDEVYIKQFSRPSTTIQYNQYIILFSRDKEVKVDLTRSVYDTNNELKMEIIKHEQERQFCIDEDKVESKEHGKITGKSFMVIIYTGR